MYVNIYYLHVDIHVQHLINRDKYFYASIQAIEYFAMIRGQPKLQLLSRNMYVAAQRKLVKFCKLGREVKRDRQNPKHV